MLDMTPVLMPCDLRYASISATFGIRSPTDTASHMTVSSSSIGSENFSPSRSYCVRSACHSCISNPS